MKKKLRLLAFAFLLFFISCINSWPEGLYVNSKTNQYEWFKGRSIPGQIYASKTYEGQFFLAKIDGQNGFKRLVDVAEVKATKLSKTPGTYLPCIAYKKTKDSFWEVCTVEGVIIAKEDEKLSVPPKEIVSVAGEKHFIY
jgi:hypothetical protein